MRAFAATRVANQTGVASTRRQRGPIGYTPQAASARTHAYAMRGAAAPALDAPGAPLVTSQNATHVAWRGSFLAANYSVDVRDEDGTWRTVCDRCATDNDTPLPLVTGGAEVRVTAYGAEGRAGPSSG